MTQSPAPRHLGSSYLMESRIGAGAQGEVWRGRRIDAREVLAFKVLRADLVENPDVVERFIKSAPHCFECAAPMSWQFGMSSSRAPPSPSSWTTSMAGTYAISCGLADHCRLRRCVPGNTHRARAVRCSSRRSHSPGHQAGQRPAQLAPEQRRRSRRDGCHRCRPGRGPARGGRPSAGGFWGRAHL